MYLLRKGQNVTVRSENGKGVNFPIVDWEADKMWVRFPNNEVLEMTFNSKRKLFVGRMARLEFTVDPYEQ